MTPDKFIRMRDNCPALFAFVCASTGMIIEQKVKADKERKRQQARAKMKKGRH